MEDLNLFIEGFRPRFHSMLEALSRATPLLVDDPEVLQAWRRQILAELEAGLVPLRDLEMKAKASAETATTLTRVHPGFGSSSKQLAFTLNALSAEMRISQKIVEDVSAVFRERAL
jgi:hypothetical protein